MYSRIVRFIKIAVGLDVCCSDKSSAVCRECLRVVGKHVSVSLVCMVFMPPHRGDHHHQQSKRGVGSPHCKGLSSSSCWLARLP